MSPWYAAAVGGYAATVQLVAGALVVALGRWPWAGWAVLAGYTLFLVHACRHRDLLPGLGRWWRRALAVVVWQAPALLFGAWNLLSFLRLAPDQDAGCVLLHAWHAVFLPLADLVPRGEWRLVAWYLWAQSAWPAVLAAALVLASRPAPRAAAPALFAGDAVAAGGGRGGRRDQAAQG